MRAHPVMCWLPKIMLAICVLATANPAVMADMVTTGMIPIQSSGQNIIVNTVAPNFWAGGTGTLSLDAMGDFDDLNGEFVDMYLDGNFIGTAGRGRPGSTFTYGSQPGMAGLHHLQATFNVSASLMQTILGTDKDVAVRMQLNRNVGGSIAFMGDYVQGTLAFSAVPEPGSLTLFGCVLGMGVRFLRRRGRCA